MYEHVYYPKKKDVRARHIIVEKMYEPIYYRKKDVRERLLS